MSKLLHPAFRRKAQRAADGLSQPATVDARSERGFGRKRCRHGVENRVGSDRIIVAIKERTDFGKFLMGVFEPFRRKVLRAAHPPFKKQSGAIGTAELVNILGQNNPSAQGNPGGETGGVILRTKNVITVTPPKRNRPTNHFQIDPASATGTIVNLQPMVLGQQSVPEGVEAGQSHLPGEYFPVACGDAQC